MTRTRGSKAALADKRAARLEAQRIRARQERIELLELATDESHWKPLRPSGKRECHICGITYRADPRGAFPCVAHFDDALEHFRKENRWCPGGAPPTVAEQARVANPARRSVNAVNAGLPTLGRR